MKKIKVFLITIFAIMLGFTGMIFISNNTYKKAYAKEPTETLGLTADTKFTTIHSYLQNLTYYQNSYYNVRDHYYLRSEYQDGYGLCWDFAGLKALENFILVNFKEYYNFSESWIAINKKRTKKTEYDYGDGGNVLDVVREMQHGVILDCDMPYEVSYSIGDNNYQTYYSYYSQFADNTLIQDFGIMPINISTYTYGSSQDTNALNYIKNYIWEYGAFFSAIDFDNVKTNALSGYSNTPYIDKDDDSSNHAILIIGYDDNYQCYYNNQLTTGAWITQNSHGLSNKFFYIPYKDYVWRKNVGLISGLTYDNYIFDFTQSSQSNYQSYKQESTSIYLYNSNTNYTAIDSIEIPKNIFQYNSSFQNQIVYKGNVSSFSSATVNIYKSRVNVTNLFNITKSGSLITIRSKNAGLDYGTYKLVFTLNGTDYLREFVVFSGIDISYMYTWSQTVDDPIFLGFLPDENGKNYFSAYTASSYTILCVDNYSLIVSYKYNTSSFTQLTNYATTNRYASGEIKIFLYSYSGIQTQKITFKTILGDEFDFYFQVYPQDSNINNPTFVNFDTNGGTLNASDYYITSFSSTSTNALLVLPKPTKPGYGFDGWYYNSGLTVSTTKSNGNWYLTNNSYILNTGKNARYVNFGDDDTKYARSTFLYAKWVVSSAFDETNFIFNSSASTDNFVYDGTAHTLTSIQVINRSTNAVMAQNVDYTVSYQNNINAGTAKAILTGLGSYSGQYEISFQIQKASNSVTVSLQSWTYGQTPKIPSASATFGTPQISYSTSYSGTYTSTKPTNAGTYFVKAYVAGTSNYYEGQDIKSFVISQASNSVSLSQQSWTYGDASINPVVSTTYGSAQITYSTSYSGTYTTTVPTNAGTYYVKAYVPASTNYSSAQDIQQFQIYKKTFDTTTISFNSQTFMYDGTTKSLAITGTLPSEITVSYQNNNKVNVGTYTVTANFTVSNNYNSIPSMQATLTIEKTNVTLEVSIQNWTYGESPKQPVVNCNVDNYQIYYSSSYSGTYTTTVPTNAGTYYIKAVVASTQYYDGAQDINQFEIYVASNSISLSQQNWTYGETAKQPTVSATFGNPQITYSTSSSGTYTTTVPTNAGTYYVKAYVSATNNYSSAQNIKSFEIYKKTFDTTTISFSSQTFVYDGTAKSLAITGTLPSEITVSYENNGKIQVGTYTVTANFAVSSNYNPISSMQATLTIERTEVNLEVSIQNWTYGDTPKQPVINCNVNDYQITYSSSYYGSYSSQVPTNAGTYYVKVFVPSTQYYDSAEQIKQFQIYKKTFDTTTISFNSRTFIYDGTTKSLAITGTLPSEITVSYLNNDKVQVGTYTVTANFTVSNNYNSISSMQAVLTIEKANVSIDISIENWTYGDTPKQPVITCNVDNYQIYYSSSYNTGYTTQVPTNAGSYYIKAIVESTQYYDGAEQIKQFQIYKKTFDTSSISFNSRTFIYDGTTKSLAITGTLPSEITVSYQNNNQIEVGTYTVTANFTVSSNYNSISSMQATLKIERNGVSLEVSIENWTYGDEPNQPVINCNVDNYQIYYSSSYSGNYTTTVPTNAGTYYIKVYVASTQYYDSAEQIKQFKINKKTFDMTNIKFESKTFIYDGTAKSLAITGTLPSEITVSYVNNDKVQVGTYTVIANFTVSNNYNSISSKQATLKIEKSEVSLEVSIENWTYGDAPKQPVVNCNVDNYQIYYSSSYSGNYTTTVPTNAGTYYIKVYVASTQYYDSAEQIKQFKINKKTFDMTNIKFESKTFIFDGTAKSLAITGTLPSEITVSYVNNDKVQVGTYTVTAKFTVSSNYNSISSMQATLKIERNGVSLEVSIENWTYGDEPNQPVINCNVSIYQIYYSSNYSTGYISHVPTNAGTYYIKVVVEATQYYDGAQDIKSFEIYKKTFDTSSISFNSRTFIYDGTAKSLAITGTLPSEITVSYQNNNQINVGTYTVTANFTVSNNYNSISSLQATLKIRNSDEVLEVSIENWTYGDTPKQPDVYCQYSGAYVLYSDEYSGTYTSTVPTNAGTYYIKAVLEETQEHQRYEKIQEFEIYKRTYDVSNIVFNSKTYIYDGQAKSLAISVAGGALPSEIVVLYDNNNKTEPGVYTVVARFFSDNYNAIPDMQATLTIKRTEIKKSSEDGKFSIKLTNSIGIDGDVKIILTQNDVDNEYFSYYIQPYEYVECYYSITFMKGDEVLQIDENYQVYISIENTDDSFYLATLSNEGVKRIDYAEELGYLCIGSNNVDNIMVVRETYQDQSTSNFILTIVFVGFVLGIPTAIIIVSRKKKKSTDDIGL